MVAEFFDGFVAGLFVDLADVARFAPRRFGCHFDGYLHSCICVDVHVFGCVFVRFYIAMPNTSLETTCAASCASDLVLVCEFILRLIGRFRARVSTLGR